MLTKQDDVHVLIYGSGDTVDGATKDHDHLSLGCVERGVKLNEEKNKITVE